MARALLDAGILTPEPVMRIESVDEAGPVLSTFAASWMACWKPATSCGRRTPGPNASSSRTSTSRASWKIWAGPQRSFTRQASGSATSRVATCCSLGRGRPAPPPGGPEPHPDRAAVPTLSERMRDLSRMPLFRPEHQEIFLSGGYWGGGQRGRNLYFALSSRLPLEEPRQAAGPRRHATGSSDLVLPRTAHAHIPEAPSDAGGPRPGGLGPPLRPAAPARQPSRQDAGPAGRRPLPSPKRRRWSRRPCRASGRRYRELRLLHEPVAFQRPRHRSPSLARRRRKPCSASLDELGARHVLLRLHPWEEDHAAEEELARELHARGLELTFALPQNRELVKDPARWRRAMEEIGPRFAPYGRASRWARRSTAASGGSGTCSEYVAPRARGLGRSCAGSPGSRSWARR